MILYYILVYFLIPFYFIYTQLRTMEYEKYCEYSETEPSKFFLYSRNNLRKIDTLLRYERDPRNFPLYMIANFSCLYLSDDKRYENYLKTGKVVLNELTHSFNTWEEYFNSKQHGCVSEINKMRAKDRKQYIESDEENSFIEEILPYFEGDLNKLYAVNPYSRFSIKEESRLYDIVEICWAEMGFDEDQIPDWFDYTDNRNENIELMTKKTQQQKESLKQTFLEMESEIGGCKFLINFVERLNNEIRKKPEPKPQVVKVIKTAAKVKTTKVKPAAKAKVTKAKTTEAKVTKPKVTKKTIKLVKA